MTSRSPHPPNVLRTVPRRAARVAGALLAALLLPACGGGGPDPAPPPFRLTERNAQPAGELLFGLMDAADRAAAEIVPIVEQLREPEVVTVDPLPCEDLASGEYGLAGHDDNDGDYRVSNGDVIRYETHNCGGVLTRSLEVSAAEFHDETRVSISGTVTFATPADARAGGQDGAEGSFRLDYRRDESGTMTSLSEVAVTLEDGRGEDALDNGRIETTVSEIEYGVEFDGHVRSESLGGAFDAETVVPFAGVPGDFPTAGTVELAAYRSRVRIGPSTAPGNTEHADVRVDAEGTGAYGGAATIAWLDWISGTIFHWYPLIRNFHVVPIAPRTDDALEAVADIYDPQDKAIVFVHEWRIGGDVVARPEEAYVFDDSRLPSALTNKGDRVEARLTVTTTEDVVSDTATVTVRNDPPALTASLSPRNPVTTDDIKLSFDVRDADGDAFETGIEWRINGTVVEGHDEARLPADRHRKHDLVGVRITASDGDDETSAELSVTIEDSPPLVEVAGMPEAVAYGAAVAFDADVSDADGDDLGAFRFALDHGPAGMTVDPLSGEVDWTATLPMFDRALDVHWGIGSTDGPVQARTGTLRVVDPDRAQPRMRSAIGPPAGPSGLRIADLDGNGRDDLVVLDGQGTLYALAWDGSTYVQTWAYPFPIGVFPGRAVATADVDGDGRREIFVVTDAVLARIDGATRRVAATAPVTGAPSCGLADVRDLEIADLDNDGSREIVFVRRCGSSEPRIVVVSADDLSVLWESPGADFGSRLALANVDRDAALEIVVSGGLVVDGSTYRTEREPPAAREPLRRFDSERDSVIGTGDFDGDGIDDIVGIVGDGRSGNCRAYSVERDATLARVPTCGEVLAVSDIDDDGIAEVLVGTGRTVLAYRYVDADGRFEEIFRHVTFTETAAIGIGDVDNDGDAEAVFAGVTARERGDGRLIVAGLGPDYDIEWTPPEDEVVRGPFLGGRPASLGEAPGETVLFVSGGGADGPKVVAFSPDSGEAAIRPGVPSGADGERERFDLSVTGAHAADYDGDGIREFLLSYDPPHLSVFDPVQAIAEWTRHTNVRHGSVSGADLNGDGFLDLLTDRAGFDIVNDTVVWESRQEHPNRAVAGDLDGDGIVEIVDARDRRDGTIEVSLYRRPDGNAEFEVSEHAYEGSVLIDLKIEDTDGDGKAEVFIYTNKPFHSRETRVIRIGADMKTLRSFIPQPSPGRVYNPPYNRLFFYRAASGETRLLLGGGSTIAEFDLRSGGKIWESPRLLGDISPDSLHLLDSQGKPRFVFGTDRAMYATR
ncbi:MAG: FG-GAP-like repeat-containing protein [Rhodospirillaceae bacterium]|nr:FG-GAP-like repeat-containing protein [Rhodospirillaceae bacterium]